MSRFRNLLLILSFLFVTGTTMSAGPRLTSAEVIRLADAEARRHGQKYDPSKFNRVDPYYAARSSEWWVRYDPKPTSRLHYSFSVTVSDRTKETWLVLP
jgi:hypothetical protein